MWQNVRSLPWLLLPPSAFFISSHNEGHVLTHKCILPKHPMSYFTVTPAARPTEQQLFHHVARNLGDDWRDFAIYLGFEYTQIQQADREKSYKDKAYEILVAWLKGAGYTPISWETILTALKNTGLTDLAHEIHGQSHLLQLQLVYKILSCIHPRCMLMIIHDTRLTRRKWQLSNHKWPVNWICVIPNTLVVSIFSVKIFEQVVYEYMFQSNTLV